MPSLPEYLQQPFEFEKELKQLFKQKEALVIFDVGACEGEDSIKFSKRFPNACIYTFEPLPKNIKRIKANFAKYEASNANLVDKALSNSDGKATFHVSSGKPSKAEGKTWDYGNKSSSLLAPAKTKTVHKWLKFKDKIEVKTERLDTFVEIEGIKEIDFLYMDVQGAEMMVLEGAGRFISRIKAIWLEVESVELYKNQPLKRDIEAFMKKHNFHKVKDTVNEVAGDQLYVNEDLYSKLIIDKDSIGNVLIGRAKRFKDKLIKKKIEVSHRKPKSKIGSKHKYKKRSFSQCGEDLIIKHALSEIGVTDPTYIDIGAHDPFYLNNTALFYLSGCRGINIEPDPDLFSRFVRHRKKDTNLNIGVAELPGKLDLFIMSSPTLNTFSEKEAKAYERQGYNIVDKKRIKVANINTLIKNYFTMYTPNILSIDVEGMDYSILKSIQYTTFSPDIICAETIGFTNDGTGKKDLRIPKLLAKNGYQVYADTKINTIFIKRLVTTS